MCLIVAKPAGVKAPKNGDLKRWFKTHDDGMGLMYSLPDGNVRILKGAMTVNDCIALHDQLKADIKPESITDIEIVYHFRQATEGTVKPGNCHPFPISKDKGLFQQTDIIIDKAIVHNGVIWDYGTYTDKKWIFNSSSDTTDTQKFIEDYLTDMDSSSLHNPGVMRLIAQYTDSKFAILDSEGITLIGKFIEDKGLYYSNGTYKPAQPIPAPVKYIPPLDSLDHYGQYQPLYDEYCDNCGKLFKAKELHECDGLILCADCYDHLGEWHYEYEDIEV